MPPATILGARRPERPGGNVNGGIAAEEQRRIARFDRRPPGDASVWHDAAPGSKAAVPAWRGAGEALGTAPDGSQRPADDEPAAFAEFLTLRAAHPLFFPAGDENEETIVVDPAIFGTLFERSLDPSKLA